MSLVIFDCDGVLVDSEVLFNRMFAEQFTAHGYPIDTETAIERFTGLSTPSVVKIVEAELGRALPDDFVIRCREAANALFDAELQAVAGIDDVLSGHAPARCVASSSAPHRIRRSLATTGLARHFADAAIFSAVMVERGKPAPDLFLHAAREMGAAPSACIVVEDSLPGVRAGVAAGMTVLGFAGASHIRAGHEERLRAAGSAHVFDDMVDLPGLLQEVGG